MQLYVMKPAALSAKLRGGHGPFLARRRGIVGLELTAIGSMGLIALYQMGIIKRLPNPPLPHFDADKVDASSEAYAHLDMPDGVLGLGSFAATLALAAMGGQQRAQTQPWLPLALAAKVTADIAFAAKLSVDQWTKHRAFCVWCLLAAGAAFATGPLAIAEARAALQEIVSKS